jgi:hypothetical protein
VQRPKCLSASARLRFFIEFGPPIFITRNRLPDLTPSTLWSAAKLAGLSRVAFEQALWVRKIAVYRPRPGGFDDNVRELARLEI